jgi:regulator of replication initiation timing
MIKPVDVKNVSILYASGFHILDHFSGEHREWYNISFQNKPDVVGALL